MLPAPLYRAVKTKENILMLLFVLIAASVPAGRAQAQKKCKLEGGIYAGIAMARLYEASNYPNGFYFRTVPDLGLQLSYGVSRWVSLGVELNYTAISTQREGLLPLENVFPAGRFPAGSYAYFSDRVDVDYLEVPVLISGTLGRRLKLFCGLGPFIGIKLNAHRTTSGGSVIYRGETGNVDELVPVQPEQSLEQNRDISGDVRAINLGGCERFGLSYKLRSSSRIWLEVRYNFGQTDIWKKDRSAEVNKTDHLALRMAYTIQL